MLQLGKWYLDLNIYMISTFKWNYDKIRFTETKKIFHAQEIEISLSKKEKNIQQKRLMPFTSFMFHEKKLCHLWRVNCHELWCCCYWNDVAITQWFESFYDFHNVILFTITSKADLRNNINSAIFYITKSSELSSDDRQK